MLAVNASLDPDDMLKAIADQACALTDSHSSAIYLHDTDTNTLYLVTGHRLPNGLAGIQLPSNEGLVGRTFSARSERVQVVDSASQPGLFEAAATHWAGHKIALLPLVARGRRWGVLQVTRGQHARPFSARDVATLKWFAPVAAQAIANGHEFYHSVHTLGQFQLSNERLRALGRIAHTLIDRSHDLDRMLVQVLEGTRKSFRMRGGAMRLYDEHTGQLVTVIERGLPDEARDHVVARGSMLIEPLSGDTGTLVTVPLVAKERAIGILQLMAPPGLDLTSDDRDALAIVANQLALGIENARLFRQIEAEEQRWRAIVSSTDNVVMSVDAKGRLLTANAAAERAFGFHAEAYISQPLSHVTTNVALNQALEQALYQLDTRRRTFQIPLLDERVLFASMSPIVAADGPAQGWVFVMQDITQFREIEQLQADMILTASHELRNPVNLVLGALELLERYINAPDDPQREALDLARLGIERASTLITDLLDLEKIDRRIGLKMERCDCTELIRAVEKEFRLQAQDHQMSLQVRMPEVPLTVWGDEKLLHRVVSNLVDNAFKYTPAGGSITLEARGEAGQVLLAVADTGPGIPLEAQPYVFERFYRLASQPDGIKGTGLGLTIVKSIVEQHGGRVWVTSQPGQGSIFTVSLPAFPVVKR
jgi:PAS domain S-box-containing protein